MKKLFFAVSAFVLVTAMLFISQANAMNWLGRMGSTNIIDCRNGYYCTQNGWINWGASWDHIWSMWW